MNQMTKPGTAPGNSEATPTADDWAMFLQPLLVSVSNPPSAQDFRKRIAAIAFALPDVTVGMMTVATQREMARKFVHWPTPAEVAGCFADALQHRRALLEYRIRPLMLDGPDPAERTPEEIAAVQAKAAAAKAALRGPGGDEEEREPVKPRYLQPRHLISMYEQQLEQATTPGFRALAQIRLDALRKQFPDFTSAAQDDDWRGDIEATR